MSNSYDVVIVGAGTTGLALARLLDMQGVRVAVVDPNTIVCTHPRGSHIDDEIMRLIQTLGLESFEPSYLRMDGWASYTETGEAIMSWDMIAGPTEQGWESDYQIFQPDLEAALRGQLAMSDSADLWLGWEVADLEQDGDGALLSVRNRRSGEARTVRASYVVGCDGAGSAIRSHVATDLVDFNATKTALIVDISRFSAMPCLPSRATYRVTGARPVTHQPVSETISRFNFMLIGDEDLERFENPQAIYDMLTPWIAPDQYRIMRSDVYRWQAHLSVGWRSGPIMIAGDAAHLMPPDLGQGMCSGLRDAANLAWKLAAVVGRDIDPLILDSYESERSPHVRRMIEESARQTNVMVAVSEGEEANSSVIERGWGVLGPGVGIPGDGSTASLAAQPKTSEGVLLDEVVGYAFAVVGSTASLSDVDALTAATWDRLGIVVVADDGAPVREWLGRIDADAVVVRPDRYIFAATHGREELAQATERLAEIVGLPIYR